MFPLQWRVVFDSLVRSGAEPWTKVKDFDSARQAVRLLFFAAREALELTAGVAEMFQSVTRCEP
jgi:hypothetical protein